MKKIFLALFAGLIGLVLVSCGPQKAEFTIEMTEFAFSPETIEVQVGQEVTINLVNKGALTHEFMVGRNVMVMEGVTNGFEHDFFEMATPTITGSGFTVMGLGEEEETDHESEHEHGGMGHEGVMVIIDGNKPDTVATMTFTVTEEMVGEWELGCFTDNGTHYDQGMKGTMIVSP